MYNILICDDEKDIVSALSIYLSTENYNIFTAYTGQEALDIVAKHDIHLILMDIMMPQMDGIAATVKLRETSNIPIILLTAKSEDSDKILGLNIGADDYITKPFGMMEFLARVKAVLRRSGQKQGEKELHCGSLTILVERHEVQENGRLVELTLKEFEVLKYLVENKGIVLTRDQLLGHVWGYDFDGETRTVDVHIRSLRQKLGDAGALIETVRGVGYRIGELK